MGGIFQLVVWKVLVSSGPLSCPILWILWGIVLEELIHRSANAFDIVMQELGRRSMGLNGRVLIRSYKSLTGLVLTWPRTPQGWKISQLEKATFLMAI